MLSEQNAKWLTAFRERRGRPLRMLHIGNIANNAYLNARFLRESGMVDADVVCYDYYHIMGAPEWEDGEFPPGRFIDHFAPDWIGSGVSGFERPRWFVQGPQYLCLQYLLARYAGDMDRADALWQQLGEANRTLPPARREPEPAEDSASAEAGAEPSSEELLPVEAGPRAPVMVRVGRRLNWYRAALLSAPDPAAALRMVVRRRLDSLGAGAAPAALLAEPLVSAVGFSARAYRFSARNYRKLLRGYHGAFQRRGAPVPEFPTPQPEAPVETPEQRRAGVLCQQFEEAFAPRKAIFREAIGGYASVMPLWSELFQHYDVVMGYATDGVYPLITGKRPYIAYEHGTIRSIPFQDDVQGQLCALTYRMADAVAITNADNIVAARKLGLTQHRFVPHPINDTITHEDHTEDYQRLHEELDSDFIVFHPSRQHWEERRHPDWEKGNDIFLKGFARFVHEVNPRAAAVLVNWGQMVPQSRELIAQLGIEHRVRWIEPLPHRAMMRMILSCDALADQFFLGAFGSTMPKALACGRPALLYLDVEKHRWCFPESPPVANVRTPEGVYDALAGLYRDPAHYAALSREGAEWYRRWHSSQHVANTLCDTLREIVRP